MLSISAVLLIHFFNMEYLICTNSSIFIYPQLLYHPYTKEEQDIAMAVEKKQLQAKEELKRAGVIGGTMDAVGGSVKMVGTGLTTVGSGGVKLVGTGVGAVGSGVFRASRMMSTGVKRLSSSNRVVNSSTPTPVDGSPMRETNGLFKSKEV